MNSGVVVWGITPSMDPPLGDKARRYHSQNIYTGVTTIVTSLFIARQAGLI
jgi:hypothetical protein